MKNVAFLLPKIGGISKIIMKGTMIEELAY